MQIVSDSGMDLSAEQAEGLVIHKAPLTITFEGKSYRSGIDIQPAEFYQLLDAHPNSFPITSQPSPGDFAAIYRELAATDPEILSIHISTGLSGTLNAAKAGAESVPEAHVTFWDTKTLSGAEGWQVEAGARAAQAGWPLPRILTLVERVRAATETLYTLDTLKYLIHGGRISHIKGLLGSVLNLKPIIGVEKEHGMYAQRGQARTLQQAIVKIVDTIARQHPPGSALRVQVMHAYNPPGAEVLRDELAKRFECTFLPMSSIAPVLGAHTGASLVGAAFAAASAFPEMP